MGQAALDNMKKAPRRGARDKDPVEAAATRKAVSNILKGSAGNLVEWFDLYVYTVFAAYFQSHFFNSTNELQAGLEAMAVFATSFLMRPVGAW
ncbi:MAG: hypothetical protein WCD21_00260, partial [Streptomyces sp.]